MFWGISESMDFFEEYKKNLDMDVDSLNILCFGTGDPRNILHTIAKSYKHSTHLNFYLVDGCAEIVARNMLLLILALEKPEVLSLRSKTHMYMDIYGNSLLRPFSSSYIASKSHVLRNVITDDDKKNETIPIFNIENLKYRERDNLESTFFFWLPKDGHIFDISKYWENRNRQTIGIRYDNRAGVFDWDLTMNLRDAGVKQIVSQEYKHWRETGIAFTFPEFEQCQPNKTMVAGLVKNGLKFLHRGYLGDQETGPYCSHGLTTSQSEMLKESYGIRDFRATDVTEKNLYEIFYEIEQKNEYVYDKNHFHKLGASTLLLPKSLPNSVEENLNLKIYNQSSLSLPNVSINFISSDYLTNITEDGMKFKNFFDIVFVAHNYFPLLKNDFADVIKNNSLVVFETKQYTLLKTEDKNDFMTKIKTFAKNIELKSITNFNINLNYSSVKFGKSK